jgi:hypothetical protein
MPSLRHDLPLPFLNSKPEITVSKTVLILNGPPGCGKDTIANEIADVDYVEQFEFKRALYTAVAAYFYVDAEAFEARHKNRDLKEVPHYWYNLSTREMLIRVSEDIIKPLFGKQYFGRQAAECVARSSADLCVFSDGGFDEELLPLVAAGFRVVVARLHRDDFTFDGDSRDYLQEQPGVEVFDVYLAPGEINEAVYQVLAGLRRDVY